MIEEVALAWYIEMTMRRTMGSTAIYAIETSSRLWSRRQLGRGSKSLASWTLM